MNKRTSTIVIWSFSAVLACLACWRAIATNAGGFFSGFWEHPSPPEASVDPRTSCGPVSLGLVCRWLDAPHGIDELGRLTQSSDTGVASLLDLRKAAESLGLAAEGVRIEPSSTIPWKLPMILHTHYHFFAALPLDPETLVIADPPTPPTIIRWDDLRGRCDGNVLVVAKNRGELDESLGLAGKTKASRR